MKLDSDALIRRLSLAVPLAGLVGLIAVFWWVPTDAVQGLPQRIFYVHVPTALIAYGAFGLVLIASIGYLKNRKPSWDRVAHASAEVGLVFTGCNIVTGMLWGKPIWGTYWTWDARLTSTFVMFLIYAGYLVFRALSTDPTRGARIAAVIGIVGFVDVPLVHYSVDWWRTLHPAMTLINLSGPQNLPASMLVTMFWWVAVFAGLYVLLMLLRVRLAKAEEALGEAEAARDDAIEDAAHPAPPAPATKLTLQPGSAQ